VKSKKPMSCPFGQKEQENFAFDITKDDRIFDFLLQEGQIKLSPNHVIPSAEDFKRIRYCKLAIELHTTQMNVEYSDKSCNRL